MTLDLCAFISKHLKFRKTVDYGEGGAELLELIKIAKLTMCRQGDGASVPLIEVPTPVKIVGDIHGNFLTCSASFSQLACRDHIGISFWVVSSFE
jgi:hypothetical protein